MKAKYGGLELEEDMSFQQRTWKVERAGWVLMALIALASILGLIDKGPFSRSRKGDAGGLQVEYERFIHLDTPTDLHVSLPVEGPFVIQLPFRYLEEAEISHVVPEPTEVASYGGFVTYSFASKPGTADILFNVTVRRAGSVKGFVQSDRQRIEFTQFVYP